MITDQIPALPDRVLKFTSVEMLEKAVSEFMAQMPTWCVIRTPPVPLTFPVLATIRYKLSRRCAELEFSDVPA